MRGSSSEKELQEIQVTRVSLNRFGGEQVGGLKKPRQINPRGISENRSNLQITTHGSVHI